MSKECELYRIAKGNKIFIDKDYTIQDVIPPIDGLAGIRISSSIAETKGAEIKIKLAEDSQILIGYMKGKEDKWLQVPQLETNAHADDRGGLQVRFRNAVKVKGCPAVDIHALQYEKGVHELYFGTGSYMIVGIVPRSTKLKFKKGKDEGPETLDWLYEEETN